MMETYRKRGQSVRWENGVLVHVSESGIAIEDGEFFACEPESSAPPDLDAANVLEWARAIEDLVVAPVTIERLIVREGVAQHECDGRTWSDRSVRIHCSLVRGRIRALFDSASMQLDVLEQIVTALARTEPLERDPPARLVLASNVTAALLPSLIGVAPPNVDLFQSAGGVDGKGLPIEEARGSRRAEFPNWYRPSYRLRALRMPLNLRLRCEVSAIESGRPRAVAILAPPDGLTLRVLIDDGEVAWPSTVRVTRIDAVSGDVLWYPYGGGSFGAEMML